MSAEHQLNNGKDNSDPPYQGELRPSDSGSVLPQVAGQPDGGASGCGTGRRCRVRRPKSLRAGPR